MSVIIHAPEDHIAERNYVFEIVFGLFLGLQWRHESAATPGVRVTFDGKDQDIRMPDSFMAISERHWLMPESLPRLPLSPWNSSEIEHFATLTDNDVPILYGSPSPAQVGKSGISIPLDIFGSVFFMLTRYCEAVLHDTDAHNRFPAEASYAYKAGFLHRPLVDEYVEILWACMKKLWPGLERKQNTPRTLVTCDLDHPYVDACNTTRGSLRHLAGDLLKRRSLGQTLQSANNIFRRRTKRDFSRDAYLKNIDWMMEANEKENNRVAFYFIADSSNSVFDPTYSMDEPIIRRLVRRIHERGHEIGLHGSYKSYRNSRLFKSEADKMRLVMEDEGVRQSRFGGRQHFLRYDVRMTPQIWEAADMDYDSSLSYASTPGFRCGTCHEYPMYDLIHRKTLRLQQRPLILMECSVIAKRHMGLGYSDAALDLMLSYKRICRQFDGCFTLLWHNHHLATRKDKMFYRALIKE